MESTAPANRRVGEGEFPAALNRVNWNAFLLGWLWVLGHGLWTWLAALLVLFLTGVFLQVLFNGTLARFFVGAGLFSSARLPRMADASRVITVVASWLLSAFFALRGNHEVWAKEARRTVDPARGASFAVRTVADYLGSERRLMPIALIVFVAGVIYAFYVAVQSGSLALTLGSHIFGVIVLVGLWAWDRKLTRVSHPAS